MTRPRLKGLAASLALVAIVAAVPVLLYQLGGGLPTSVPSAHQTALFLGRPLANNDLIEGVSLVCWAVWALFVIAVGSEAAAWARRRPSPSQTRRGFRIPGMQGVAGSLFVTAMLLLPQRPITTAHTSTLLLSPPAPISAVATGQPLSGSPIALPGDTRTAHTVQRGETLWGLAEAHVGNGLAWRQITDAEGHNFDTGRDQWVQADGHPLLEREARLIFPGETVYLPASWSPKPPTPIDTATTAPVSSLAPTTSSSSTTPADATYPMSATPTSTPSSETTASKTNSPHAESRDPGPIEIAGLLGVGMVAGAALSTLTRMRARQSRYRRPGRRIRLPHGELADLELELRAAQRPDLIDATHRALGALANDLYRSGAPVPAIGGVIASDEAIELVLEQPQHLTGSWEASDAGRRWVLPIDQIHSHRGHELELLPCLVPVGRLQGSTAEVLINLEAAGVVTATGDPSVCRDFVQTAALALSGLPWATSADIIVIGGPPELAAAAVHLRVAESAETVIDELEERLPETSNDGRRLLADRPDGWLPTILLISCELDRHVLDRIASLCIGRSGVCALVAGPGDQRGWTIDLDSKPVAISQLGIRLEPFTPSVDGPVSIQELIETASDNQDVATDQAPYNQLESGTKTPIAVPLDFTEQLPVATDPAPDRLPARFNVLGTVTFDGIGDFLRPRSFEIALYLALHRDGISESRLDETIWPAKAEVARSTRDQAISAARNALGGRDRFPYAQGQGPDKIYRLSDQVTTDWSEFCTLHRQGRQLRTVEPLQAALDLVRGHPFGDLDGGPGFRWLHTEGHIHHMEAEIADTADLAARLYLEADRPVEARRAATQGLLAGPYTERLWVHLMAAADALGEAQEIERLLDEMDRRLGLDGDFAQLHPDTITAYRNYSRQRVSPQ